MKPSLALLLAAAGGAAVAGVVVAPWIGSRAGAPADPYEESALVLELRRLGATQDRTAAVLERLEAALAERLVPPAVEDTHREPAGAPSPAPESLDELVASLGALRDAIELESRRTQELIRTAPALGGTSLDEARRRSPATNWVALEELEKQWHDDAQAVGRSQYFRTVRDVIETYGPPTAIYRPRDRADVLLHYRRGPEGEPGWSWYFRVHDGYVVEFWMEDEGDGGQ